MPGIISVYATIRALNNVSVVIKIRLLILQRCKHIFVTGSEKMKMKQNI